jgi:hypothetical protein
VYLQVITVSDITKKKQGTYIALFSLGRSNSNFTVLRPKIRDN